MVVMRRNLTWKTYVDYYKFDMITQDFKFRLAMIITLACIIAAAVFECINRRYLSEYGAYSWRSYDCFMGDAFFLN